MSGEPARRGLHTDFYLIDRQRKFVNRQLQYLYGRIESPLLHPALITFREFP